MAPHARAIVLAAVVGLACGCSRSQGREVALAAGQGGAQDNGNAAGAGGSGAQSGAGSAVQPPDRRDDGRAAGGSNAGRTPDTGGVAGSAGTGTGTGTGTNKPGTAPGPNTGSGGGSANAGSGDGRFPDPGTAGVGGANDAGSFGSGHDILNPHGCTGDRPFVLTIQASGDRGNVSGWLESSPTVAFEGQLPRFDATPDRDLALWWSIGSIASDGQQAMLYFYGQNDATRVAVATGARDFSDIKVDALVFDDWVTPALPEGAIAVFLNIENKQRVAMRVDKIFNTDPSDRSGFCAGIDASWSFVF